MPRYFFNVASPNRVVVDQTGRELDGLEAAHWRAVSLAYQVRFHLPDEAGAWVIQIQDEGRHTREIFVPFFGSKAWSGKKRPHLINQPGLEPKVHEPCSL